MTLSGCSSGVNEPDGSRIGVAYGRQSAGNALSNMDFCLSGLGTSERSFGATTKVPFRHLGTYRADLLQLLTAAPSPSGLTLLL
jgi:hypothetical protein